MTSYTNKPIHNITNGTFTQVFSRKSMGQLWNNRSKLDKGQSELIDCLYKATKKRGVSRCEYNTEYKLSASQVGKLGYGRYYGLKGSLETLEKDIRGTLCSDFYDDIDCVNCHPTIIPQMSIAWFNTPMPAMQSYVDNRDKYFDMMEENARFDENMTKALVLRLIYGGAVSNSIVLPDESEIEMPHEFLQMKQEMRAFSESLMKVNDHKPLLDYVKRLRKPNAEGSFTSHIVQSEERKILESMVHAFKELNFKVDVLAYDGVQIRKEVGKSITDAVLASIQDTIKTETGYTILLKNKPFETISFESDDVVEGESYETVKAEWETNHFYFRPSNTICEIGSGGIQHFGIEHATEAFNGFKCVVNTPEGRKVVPFLKEWRNDASRRIITKIVAKMPSECEADEISLFRGWAFQQHIEAPICIDAVDTFCDLVRGCAGDTDELYHYLLKCFARIVQQPLVKSNTCTILSSRLQGSGKDTLMLWITNLLGNHTSHYSSEDAFWSPHDTTKEGAIFVHLEEASPGENQKRCDALKARITEDITTVNPKGVKAYAVPNVGNVFMTTQHPIPVKMEAHDRRFFILNPSDRCFKKGPAYWTKIYTNFKTSPWMRSVGEFLANYDITEFNPTVFPDTKMRCALLEVLETECPNVRFMKQWAGSDCTSDELFDAFKSWCRENDESCYSKLTFCKMIASRCPELYSLRRSKTGMRYSPATQ